MKSLKTTLMAVAAAAVMSFNAHALTAHISDPSALGDMVNMDGSDPVAQAGYVNTMIGLGLNGTSVVPHPPADEFNDFIITRSNNSFSPMPGLVNAGDSSGNKNTTDNGFTTTGSGWDIVLAKYGNHSIVWVLDGAAFDVPLNGTFSVPNNRDVFEDKTLGLSHWIGFRETTNVPDGGSTVALLGATLAGLSMIRRKK